MIVLQVLGWVLLGLLLVLIVLLLVPVHVLVDYTSEGFGLRVRALFLTFRILPQKPARKRKKDKTDEPPQEEFLEPSQQVPQAENAEEDEAVPQNSQTDVPLSDPKSAEAAQGKTDTQSTAPVEAAQAGGDKPVSKKRKRKWTLDDILTLVRTAGAGLRMLLRDLRVTHIRVYLPVHVETADETARLYGQIHAYVGGAIGVLRNVLQLQFQELCIEPDFCDVHAGQARFSCRVTGCLLTVLLAGIHVLLRLKQEHVL